VIVVDAAYEPVWLRSSLMVQCHERTAARWCAVPPAVAHHERRRGHLLDLGPRSATGRSRVIPVRSVRLDAALRAAGIAGADTAITRRYLFSAAASAKQPSSARHPKIRVA
jgi:hypothetical protein